MVAIEGDGQKYVLNDGRIKTRDLLQFVDLQEMVPILSKKKSSLTASKVVEKILREPLSRSKESTTKYLEKFMYG